MPEGYSGEGFFATSMNNVVGLGTEELALPLAFATSCCGIEFMATMASHYDLARFGAGKAGFYAPAVRLLMVMGTMPRRWDRS